MKGCRRFARTVNLFEFFCPELQKVLKPIYDLPRKDRQFMWGEKQQLDFVEISRLIKPPVLYLPDNKGRFLLYLDTSKFAMGSALYQIRMENSS